MWKIFISLSVYISAISEPKKIMSAILIVIPIIKRNLKSFDYFIWYICDDAINIYSLKQSIDHIFLLK